MSNFTEQFVALTMATLKADGRALRDEIGAIKALAERFNLNAPEVEKLIHLEAQKKDVDPIAVAKNVSEQADKILLLEASAVVALSDRNLDEKEVDLLLAISNALGLPMSKFVLSIARVVQDDPNIQIAGKFRKYE